MPTLTSAHRVAIAENLRLYALLAAGETLALRTLIGDRLKELAAGTAHVGEATDDLIAAALEIVKAPTLEDRQLRARIIAEKARTKPTLLAWDRAQVLAQIEEATGTALHVDDPQPDTYIATAQELGMQPCDLTLWIYESGKEWNAESLRGWARRYGFARGGETMGGESGGMA
jgi:FMN phosphatase YigB (HAD superfamily)